MHCIYFSMASHWAMVSVVCCLHILGIQALAMFSKCSSKALWLVFWIGMLHLSGQGNVSE